MGLIIPPAPQNTPKPGPQSIGLMPALSLMLIE